MLARRWAAIVLFGLLYGAEPRAQLNERTPEAKQEINELILGGKACHFLHVERYARTTQETADAIAIAAFVECKEIWTRLANKVIETAPDGARPGPVEEYLDIVRPGQRDVDIALVLRIRSRLRSE
jgi:hypothetical protein